MRVDAGVEEGSEVPPHYDPLVAKIVAHGRDRDDALACLRDAIGATELLGPRTNVSFLRALLDDGVVKEGSITTEWLERAHVDRTRRPPSERAVAVAAAAEADAIRRSQRSADPWVALGPWRATRDGATHVVLRPQDEERSVAVAGSGPFTVGEWTVTTAGDRHGWTVDGARVAAVKGGEAWLVWDGDQHEIPVGIGPRRIAGAGPAHLGSPLPGQVIAVRVEAGQHVAEDEELVVVEAMKMEHAIRATSAGIVRAVLCAAGDKVERGQPLVDIEPVT